jgi:hypothetical protein
MLVTEAGLTFIRRVSACVPTGALVQCRKS